MEISNIYLTNLKIDNYKSLKDCNVDLQMGLNIIIGKNGAGKSNLLDFIFRYATNNLFTSPQRSLINNFNISIAYRSRDYKPRPENMEPNKAYLHVLEDKESQNLLSFGIERIRREEHSNGQDSNFIYELTINQTKDKEIKLEEKITIPATVAGVVLSDPALKVLGKLGALRDLKKKYVHFELPQDAYWVVKPNRLIVDETAAFEESSDRFSYFKELEGTIGFAMEGWEMFAEGDQRSLENFKQYLIDTVNQYLSQINSILNKYTPISKIRFNPNLNVYRKETMTTAENLAVDFLIDENWMPWSYLSDGTKRLFYIVSECLTIEKGVILIEEPELGIHPHQLLRILGFLKEQSRTKQIIISTHSPLTLDILKEDELDRIIIAKYEKGTKFFRLNKAEVRKAKKYINEVGELSYYWIHSDLEK